ncbi:MAG TPA: hypothetical protein EYP17_03410 [Candidatus Latescibacteria bacterium]|nr:hypothetical protein [Candidatus Latescibacterota bacterium]
MRHKVSLEAKVYRRGDIYNGIYRDNEGRSRSVICLVGSEDGLCWEDAPFNPIILPTKGWKVCEDTVAELRRYGMRVGVWLHDHFYRKHCGRPMVFLQGVRGRDFWGMECAEVGGLLIRLEAMAPCFKDRGDITLVLHTEGDPNPTRCGSGNSHLRRAAVETIKWDIDLAVELGACTCVVPPSEGARIRCGVLKRSARGEDSRIPSRRVEAYRPG